MADARLTAACTCSPLMASSVKNRITVSISFANLSCQPRSLSFPASVSNRLRTNRSQGFSLQRSSTVEVNAAVGYPASITWWKKGNQPNMREISSAYDFADALNKAGDKLVLVDFFSIGCRSCKAIYPKICQLAAENPDIVVLKVNFYDNDTLCRRLNVKILPFFHFYHGAEGRLDAFSCSLTKVEKLRQAVARHKNDIANRERLHVASSMRSLATAGSTT